MLKYVAACHGYTISIKIRSHMKLGKEFRKRVEFEFGSLDANMSGLHQL